MHKRWDKNKIVTAVQKRFNFKWPFRCLAPKKRMQFQNKRETSVLNYMNMRKELTTVPDVGVSKAVFLLCAGTLVRNSPRDAVNIWNNFVFCSRLQWERNTKTRQPVRSQGSETNETAGKWKAKKAIMWWALNKHISKTCFEFFDKDE